MNFKSILLQGATNSVIKEAQARFGTKPNFPKTPEAVEQLFSHLDKLIPKGAQASGVGKQMYFFLLRLLCSNPAGFVLGEDDYKVRPLMENYFIAIQKNKLQGGAKNLDNYIDLEALEEVLSPESKDKAAPKVSPYSPEQQEAIKAGAEKVLVSGGWIVWKIPQSTNQIQYEAARALCDNDLHRVKWCVGRPGYAKNYISKGDFFVLEKNGKSEYAISSIAERSLTIWNPADTPIFNVGGGYSGEGTEHTDYHLNLVANNLGIELNLNDLGSLPSAIEPVLEELRKTQKAIQIIPERAFSKHNTTEDNLFRVLHEISSEDFVADLSLLASSRRSNEAMVQRLLNIAVSDKVRMPFSDKAFESMVFPVFKSYITALAASGIRSLPEYADTMLSKLMKAWIR